MVADDEMVSRVAARNALRRRVYPEVAAGGFTRVDGTVEFYTRVNALLRPDMVVVDYGAGRGRFVEDESAPLRRDLRTLQGKVAKVVGLDVDDAVLSNPVLDEAHVPNVNLTSPELSAFFVSRSTGLENTVPVTVSPAPKPLPVAVMLSSDAEALRLTVIPPAP